MTRANQAIKKALDIMFELDNKLDFTCIPLDETTISIDMTDYHSLLCAMLDLDDVYMQHELPLFGESQ